MTALREVPVDVGEVYGYILVQPDYAPFREHHWPSVFSTVEEARELRNKVNTDRLRREQTPLRIAVVREVIVE